MGMRVQKKTILKLITAVGLWGLAIIYCMTLSKIVIFKNGFTTECRGLNLLPFQFWVDLLLHKISMDVLLKDVLGNFAIFIPMGILIPSIGGYVNRTTTIILGFLVSLVIEVMQYVIGLGIADVDDLILSTLGVAAGAYLYFLVLRKLDKKANVKVATLGSLTAVGFGALSLWMY